MPAAPELPGKNYPASRQVMRQSHNGNSISLPGGFHARGFVSPAKGRNGGPPQEQPGLAPSQPPQMECPGQPAGSPHLASKKGEKGECQHLF